MNKILLTFLLLTLTGIVFGFGSLIEKQFDTITPPSGSLTLKNSIIIDSGTATTVTYLDGSKAITSSSVTPTQLEFLNTTTQDIQVSLDAKASFPASLTSDVSDILPVANGGTNSSDVLSNDFVMQSVGGSIVESLTTTQELSFLNTTTQDIQTQLNGKEPSITTLPISQGGSNSNVALASDLVMISVGGSIIESLTTTQELFFLNSSTQDIQTALNTKLETVDLTSDVTGVLPIANGGTGETNAINAFDSLAPTTSKGDIIVSNGTDNIRIPIGANTQVLTADNTEASGVKWAAGGGGGGGAPFSAIISSAGVVTAENTEWINGNCVIGSGRYTCTFTVALFSVTPTCLVTYNTAVDPDGNIRIDDAGTTASLVKVFPSDAAGSSLNTLDGFNLYCQE